MGLSTDAAARKAAPTTRKQALQVGSKFYWSGKPCAHGHMAPRRATTRACSECSRDWDRRRYHADPEGERARSRKYQRQHLPVATRPCPAVCELCGNPPKSRSLSLDHCHTTHAFRGWLCGECNMALGKLGDSAESLARAAAYLAGNFIHPEAANGATN